MTGRRFLDIHAYLNYKKTKKTLPLSRNRHVELHKTIIIQKVLEHVCVFENPLPVMENETHARHKALNQLKTV